jgi:hypothetical protein
VPIVSTFPAVESSRIRPEIDLPVRSLPADIPAAASTPHGFEQAWSTLAVLSVAYLLASPPHSPDMRKGCRQRACGFLKVPE